VSPWPDSRVALLRRLVAQGLSGAAIGAEMDLTKNQIVGACRRRGIRLQGNNNGGGCRTGQVLKLKPPPVVRKRKAVVAPVVVVPAPVLPPSRAKRCQWIEQPGPPWFTCDGPVQPRSPYCAEHHSRVFLRHREPVA
jgi:hypothetical protein